MDDLVRILQTYCGANNISFHYGSEAHLNLLDGDLDNDKVYLLLFPVKRKTIQSVNSLTVQGRRFTGRYMLLKGSDYANHYFNENEKDEVTSKYTLNIEPLLNLNDSIVSGLMCAGLEIDNHECDDAVNVLDSNKDGVWCSFNYVLRI